LFDRVHKTGLKYGALYVFLKLGCLSPHSS